MECKGGGRKGKGGSGSGGKTIHAICATGLAIEYGK
jgi:hypothetical protein